MTNLATMVQDVRKLAQVESDVRALRWLRAAASTLAAWGGSEARKILETALPKELFSGAGTRGRSAAKAQAAVGGSAATALFAEIGERAGEEDPGKMGQTATAAIALLKLGLPADQLPQLLAALPAEIAAEVRDASACAPWKYFLIPQSYARPAAKRRH